MLDLADGMLCAILQSSSFTQAKCFAPGKSYRKWWYVGPLCPYWWTGTVFLCKVPVIMTPVYLTSLDMVGQMHANWNIWWTNHEAWYKQQAGGDTTRPNAHLLSLQILNFNHSTRQEDYDYDFDNRRTSHDIFWLVLSMIPLHTFPTAVWGGSMQKKLVFSSVTHYPTFTQSSVAVIFPKNQSFNFL